ncbi:MAG: hypothetical protein JWO49_279 [Arthrobacter sp.]|nr:hypothetical protein [Arthrobacter sp.]MCU1549073.1 hypothetical protein [Arthrobacter sp.]
MEHLDAELLSLLALGEPLGTDTDAAHLANCPECSETLSALQHTVHVATLDPAGIPLEEPGSHNWAAIHQALGLSTTLAADPLSQDTAGPPAPPGNRTTEPVTPGTPLTHDDEAGVAPTPLRPGTKDRQARPGGWITVAAAGIVLGAAAGWTAAGVLGRPVPPAPAPAQSSPAYIVLAQTSLTPLASHTGSGDARVEQLPDGTRRLVIRLSDDKITGFREVWVASPDLSRMVSLGVLANESGVFTLPAGIDLGQYPIVDVSDQPYNGNPAHSGDSIVRGQLTSRI